MVLSARRLASVGIKPEEIDAAQEEADVGHVHQEVSVARRRLRREELLDPHASVIIDLHDGQLDRAQDPSEAPRATSL